MSISFVSAGDGVAARAASKPAAAAIAAIAAPMN
jgi:hypothetical protein